MKFVKHTSWAPWTWQCLFSWPFPKECNAVQVMARGKKPTSQQTSLVGCVLSPWQKWRKELAKYLWWLHDEYGFSMARDGYGVSGAFQNESYLQRLSETPDEHHHHDLPTHDKENDLSSASGNSLLTQKNSASTGGSLAFISVVCWDFIPNPSPTNSLVQDAVFLGRYLLRTISSILGLVNPKKERIPLISALPS